MEDKNDEIIIYRVGLVSASTCARNDVPIDEVAKELNRLHPTGVTPWTPSDDKEFVGGEPNPHPCNIERDNRTHYLFEC